MDFGRIENIEQVDFTLPPDHKSIGKVLGEQRSPAPKAYVGGVRWASDSFVGTIYPPKAKPADYIKYYLAQFNTIELNTTHYGLPTEATFEKWEALAPEGFKFCPKVHQNISHAGDLLQVTAFHNECNMKFKLLDDRLGTVFMQLPPQFSPERLNELMAFLDKNTMPGMAIELRHPDWFKKEKALNDLCNYLYKSRLCLVLTDTPGRRDVLHMRLTNKTAFVRFNAHQHFAGDKPRMDAWIERANAWFDQGLEQLYFFVHTPQQIYMPQQVTYFIERLNEACGIKLNPPALSTAFEPENSLFRKEK